jgi:hypothetical protein
MISGKAAGAIPTFFTRCCRMASKRFLQSLAIVSVAGSPIEFLRIGKYHSGLPYKLF